MPSSRPVLLAVLLVAAGCTEPVDSGDTDTGEPGPAPGFPFPVRQGHPVVAGPEEHADRGLAWDLDCAPGDGVGAVAGGTVTRATDGHAAGEAEGNEVCVRHASSGLTVCLGRLEAGTLANVAEGGTLELGQRLGGCGSSGPAEDRAGDATHLEVWATDDAGDPVRLAHPDRWWPLATLEEPEAPVFAVTHPAGGEAFPLETIMDVRWEPAGLDVAVDVVAFHGPSGAGPPEERVRTLEEGGANDGRLEGVLLTLDWAFAGDAWYVCVDAGTTGDCGGAFSITSDAILEVRSPVASGAYEIGGTLEVAWTSEGQVGPVDVRLCNGPGGTCEEAERVRLLEEDGDDDGSLPAVFLDPAWAWDDADWYVCVEGPGARDCTGAFTLVTPTTPLTVGCGGDHDTLQAAVDAALDGATIEVCEGSFAGPTTIRALALTIRGAGAGATLLTAGPDEGILTVDAGADVALVDLAVGAAECPNLDACALSAGASTLRLERVVVRDVSGLRSPGLAAASATVTLQDVTIARIVALDGSSGACLDALYSRVEADGLRLEDCVATDGVGAGLHAEGSEVILSDSWILGGRAGVAGGGAYVRSASALTLTGGGITGCEAADGGALFASRSSSVALAGAQVQANVATERTGGAFQLLAETPTDITTLDLDTCDLGSDATANTPADLEIVALDGRTATCTYGGTTTLSASVERIECP